MKDYGILKSEIEKLAGTLRKDYMLVADKHGFEFANNCVISACITAIASVLNTNIHEDRDKALNLVIEEITWRTNVYGKSVAAVIDKARLS